MRTLIVLLLFSVVGIYTSINEVHAISDNEKQVILTLHNYARSLLGISPLTWDNKIASAAQSWADTLGKKNMFQHSSSKSRSGRGENLYMIWGNTSLSLESDGTDAVESWIGESEDYNHETRTCTKGKVCGHYTQLIWGTTKKVGCGKSVRNAGGITKIYWVCQYSPAGNIIGKNPY